MEEAGKMLAEKAGGGSDATLVTMSAGNYGRSFAYAAKKKGFKVKGQL